MLCLLELRKTCLIMTSFSILKQPKLMTQHPDFVLIALISFTIKDLPTSCEKSGVETSGTEGRDFDSQLSQTNDLPN